MTDDATSRLHRADAAAIDALVAAGFRLDRVHEEHRERAERALLLLAHLDGTPVGDPATLTDLAYLRVMRAGAPEPELCTGDADALDAWMLAKHDVSRVPSSLRERARRHEELAELVSVGGPAPSASLIERTLAGVQQTIDDEEDSHRLVMPRMRFRMADLISAAAVVLIAASVLWPVANEVRFQQSKAMCGSHMASLAGALMSYAGDNRNAMPFVTPGPSGTNGTWWDVGHPQSNSANLYTLVHEGYTALADMACPGNPHATTRAEAAARDWRSLDEVSYSYQIMSGPHRPRWNGGRVLVLADASPVVRAAIRGRPVDPWAGSNNHAGRGQHGLWNDGSATWLSSAVLPNGDNIWLPRSIEEAIARVQGRQIDPIAGTETPGGVDDSFVGP